MYKAYKHLQQYYATNTAVLSIQNTPCLIQLKKKNGIYFQVHSGADTSGFCPLYLFLEGHES